MTTMMFTVANYLSEKFEGATYECSFCSKDGYVTTYTFEAFEKLFCLLESPIAPRYYSLYRKFIFQGGSEEESGYWATDEVTGEQGYVDGKHLCFWSWDDNQSTWKSRPFKSRLLKRRQVEGKDNEKVKENDYS